jgi:hypothetical protein
MQCDEGKGVRRWDTERKSRKSFKRIGKMARKIKTD